MTVSDEMIISALLSNSTNAAAAEELNISETYLYKRMRSPEFQDLFSEAKKILFKSCLEQTQRSIMDAVGTMIDIMNDTENSAQVRLNAAQAVVTAATRLQASATKERTENELLRWAL